VTDRATNGRGVIESRPFDLAAVASEPEHPTGAGASVRPLHPLQAELIAAAGAVLLLVSLLLLPGFGVAGRVGRFAPRAATIGSEGAWHTLTVLRWPALLTVAVALMPLLARPAQRWLGLPRRTHEIVAALGGLTALLLAYRVLIQLPDPSRVVDQQAGAILGLLGALVIALGGLESIRAHAAPARARRATRVRHASSPPGELARARG
jgi:hypothetical protein